MTDPHPSSAARRAWLIQAMKTGARYRARAIHAPAHNAINLTVLSLNVLALVGLLALGAILPGWLHLILAGPLFGLGCYTLIAFVVHEASHDLFILSSDKGNERWWNRFFGWCCSVPFGLHYLKHWEEGHRVHHTDPLEAQDPQRFNVATGWPLVRVVLGLVFVPFYVYLHRFTTKLPAGRTRSSPWVMVAFVAFWAVVGLLATGAWGGSCLWVILWGHQWASALNHGKGALEHGGPMGADPELLLRSRTSLVPFAGLLGIYNATIYHFEHHLHPKVPWYALPAFHREIVGLVPAALADDIFNRRILDQLRGRIGATGQGRTAEG